MNVIEVSGLKKQCGDFQLNIEKLYIPKGYIWGIIGENGAGKSLLIRSILGIEEHDEGHVRVFSEILNKNNRINILNRIGVVWDDSYWPSYLTAQDISYMMESCYTNWDGRVFSDYLKRFQVPPGKALQNLSKGTLTKMMIAISLSHSPDLLFFDESTANLDPFRRKEFFSIIKDYCSNGDKTIVLSSHIISDVERNCDFVTLIKDGRVVVQDDIEGINMKYGLLKVAKDDLAKIPPESIVFANHTQYAVELLVFRDRIKELGLDFESSSLEDLLDFLTRKEDSL